MSKKKLAEWFVYRIVGAKAASIGLVKATTADDAITEAIKEYGLDPDERNRLIAQPH